MSVKSRFDRKSLKGTSLKVIQEQNNEIASSSKKREYLKIKEGTNKIRIFPAHPNSDEKDRYAQKKYVAWLPYKNDEGKISSRSYMNAKVHAGQKKDLIEEYVRVATEIIQVDKSLTTKDKAEKLNSLVDFKKGIGHQGKYLAYAEEVGSGNRGLIEFTFGVKKKLDAISLAEIEEDSTAPDVISDPNEGYILTIKYDTTKTNTEKYSVQLGRKVTPVSDESLDWWFEEDSIYEILHGNVNYHQGIIDSIKSGLEIYDEKNDLGIVNSNEFLDVFKELRAELPEAPQRDGDSGGSNISSDDDEAEEDEKTLGEHSKDELKKFIIEADLDIKIYRKDTVEDALEKIEFETGLTDLHYPSDLSEISESPKVEDDSAFEEDEEEGEYEKTNKSDRTRHSKTEVVEEDVEENEPKKSRRTRRSRQ